MLPPRPPSPPSGPPRGTNFSRRKLADAVAAFAGVDFDHCFVDEFHSADVLQTKKPCRSEQGLSRNFEEPVTSGGDHAHRLAFGGPCCANSTRPVTFANSV